MLAGANLQLRWSGEPAVHTRVAVVLARPVAVKVTKQPLYAPVLVNANVTPPDAAVLVVALVEPAPATLFVPLWPAPVQVLASRAAVTTVVLLPVTRLPLASVMRSRT